MLNGCLVESEVNLGEVGQRMARPLRHARVMLQPYSFQHPAGLPRAGHANTNFDVTARGQSGWTVYTRENEDKEDAVQARDARMRKQATSHVDHLY